MLILFCTWVILICPRSSDYLKGYRIGYHWYSKNTTIPCCFEIVRYLLVEKAMIMTYVFQLSLTSFYPVQAYSHLVKLFYSKDHHDV